MADDPLHVEVVPLDTKRHDRTAFSSGHSRVDNFLRFSASKLLKDNQVRIYVAVEPNQSRVLGYYAINATSIDNEALDPDQRSRKTPFERVSAVYLSFLGTDRTVQGRGLGTALLFDAMKRVAVLSEQTGIYAIVIDAVDEERAEFYRKRGFVDCPGHPLKMAIRVKTIQKLI